MPIPLNQLDAIAFGQAELVGTARNEVVHREQYCPRQRAADATSGGHVYIVFFYTTSRSCSAVPVREGTGLVCLLAGLRWTSCNLSITPRSSPSQPVRACRPARHRSIAVVVEEVVKGAAASCWRQRAQSRLGGAVLRNTDCPTCCALLAGCRGWPVYYRIMDRALGAYIALYLTCPASSAKGRY